MNGIPPLPEEDDALVGLVATRSAAPPGLVSVVMLAVMLLTAFVLG